MYKVTNELEALALCKEYMMKIDFRKDFNYDREYVVVNFGFKEVAGKTLIEAVNRIVDLYHNAPINYEKLDWYEESQKYLYGRR